jgi:hypothetical protein
MVRSNLLSRRHKRPFLQLLNWHCLQRQLCYNAQAAEADTGHFEKFRVIFRVEFQDAASWRYELQRDNLLVDRRNGGTCAVRADLMV